MKSKKKKEEKIGKQAIFHNAAHYPSLHRSIVTIVNDYGDESGHYRFGVIFPDGGRMAVSEHELQLLPE